MHLRNYMPNKYSLMDNEILDLKKLEKKKENKELFEKYQKARGTLFELLCYYAVSNHKNYKEFTAKSGGI